MRDTPPPSLVYYARVVSTADPLQLGRVQVAVRGFGAELDLKDVWLRMLHPAASDQSGFVFLPEEGDEVALLRGAGDALDGMLLLGALYNGKRKPRQPNSDGKNSVKEIRTKAGNAITLIDEENAEAIVIETAGAKMKITLANAGKGTITIEGATTVELKGPQKIKVTTKSEVAFEAKKISIKASDSLVVGGKSKTRVFGNQLAVEGQQLKLDGKSKVEIAGAKVNIG